ncbi:phage tail protein [Lachnoanaerobaculum orale]|uniref:phage tail-collar fiber domain-containing protein n=1 Tax=Lachnoanaerobaculum orale TaxID=979627 RepID=UPI0023A891AB|nr:phage tail protein [Lachnoanaerobaculum orale]
MASFRSTVVTNTGISVINTALSNKQELKISSIKSGNGTYTGSENLENAAGLKDLKNSFHIKNIKLVDDATIKIQALITNDDITVGYDITEYGIYAEVDGLEKLIAIATAINADFIPSKESSPASILLEIYLKVSRAKEIHFSYTVPEGVYATVAQLEGLIDKDSGLVAEAKLPDAWLENVSITDVTEIGTKRTIKSALSALVAGLKFVVNMLSKTTEVWMRVDGFTQTAPYTLRIDMPEMKSTYTPIISHLLLDGVTDAEVIKGAWKSYDCIDRVDTFDGYIIVSCFGKRPKQDILLGIKGR